MQEAGAFVLSSLYHVFGQKDLKEIAQFSLVFSLALLPVAAVPLLLHLQQPTRAIEPLLTPHFTSAIAAFGIVFSTYGLIVVSEIWFVYRRYFVEQVHALKDQPGIGNRMSPKEWNEANRPIPINQAIKRKNAILEQARIQIDPAIDAAIRKDYKIYFN